MTPAEFRVIRDSLGLTLEWLSDHLDVNPRTVARWDSGASRVPHGVAETLHSLEAEAARTVQRMIEDLADDRTLVTYRTDADYRAVVPDVDRPASWHRALCGRVRQLTPDVRITYWADPAVDVEPHPYYVAKAVEALRRAGGSIDDADNIRALAKWAQARKDAGDLAKGVLVTRDGRIVAGTFHSADRWSAVWYVDMADAKRYDSLANVLDMAKGVIERAVGEQTVHLTGWDLASGAAPKAQP